MKKGGKKKIALSPALLWPNQQLTAWLWFSILYGTFSRLFVSLLGMARRLIWLDPEEQTVLDQVAVRLIGPHK